MSVVDALRCITTDARFALSKRGTRLREFNVARGFTISVLSIASCPSTGKCAHTRQVVADLRQHEELVYAFKSRYIAWRIRPTVLPHPNTCSMRLRFCWLTA
jgi:hypothetical protein